MGGLLILFLAGLYFWGAYKVDQRSFSENDTYIITPGENKNFRRVAAWSDY